MVVSGVVRVKLAIFAVICFVLWQAMRNTVPSAAPFLNVKSGEDESHISSNVEPVKVNVFYETLCPDSRSFVMKQLLPSCQLMPHLIDLNLKPYGKAQTQVLPDGSFKFECQHGPLECQGNKVHACAISKVKDKEVLLKYIACMISDNMNPEAIGKSCAQLHGVLWEPILECSRGKEGDNLLYEYGRETHEISPSFIPLITLNGDRSHQAAILKNLTLQVCNCYNYPKPEECS